MSYESTRIAIETFFQNGFTSSHINYDDNADQIDNKTPYVSFYVEFLSRNRIVVGESQFRIVGIIMAQCFAPEDGNSGAAFIGKAGAGALADDVQAVFDGQSFDGVVIEDATPTRVGSGDAFYQFNVAIRFHRDVSSQE